MKLSGLLDRFNEPETLKMAKLGRELRAQGIDIVDLSLGEPDFDTPNHIKQAAIQAINENYSHYTPVAGYLDLREAVCFKLERDNNLFYKPENIIVSTGAKQSIANAVLAVVDKGDEVIIPTPYWVTYSEIVRLAGADVKLVRTSIENNYKITAQELEESISEKTKLFMFSSPCNPTGSVYSKQELKSLVEVFLKYPQIIIMSDEIYEYINYESKHESIAQFEEIKDRVIIINGLSKGYAMTGWRLGYVAANTQIVKACEKIQGQFTSGTNSIAQRAAIVALRESNEASMEMVEAFKKRKQIVLDLASEIKGWKTPEPQGAFYIFPNVEDLFGKSFQEYTINSAAELSMYLLHEAHVSTVTGSAFGEPNCIRLSFANSEKNIREGFKRIKEAINKLN